MAARTTRIAEGVPPGPPCARPANASLASCGGVRPRHPSRLHASRIHRSGGARGRAGRAQRVVRSAGGSREPEHRAGDRLGAGRRPTRPPAPGWSSGAGRRDRGDPRCRRLRDHQLPRGAGSPSRPGSADGRAGRKVNRQAARPDPGSDGGWRGRGDGSSAPQGGRRAAAGARAGQLRHAARRTACSRSAARSASTTP